MKKIPEIRFPEFSGEWVEKRLGEVCDIVSSKRILASFYQKEGIPFFRGNEITQLSKDKNIEDLDIIYIPTKLYNKISKQYGVPKENDILITAIGTIGNSWIVPKGFKFYFKDGNLLWLKNIKLNVSFLNHYLAFSKNKLYLFSYGSSQNALTISNLKSLKIHIPPTLAEQKKIANFLSSIDKKIEIVSKKIEKLKEYKKGLLQKLLNVKCKNGTCEPELRFKEFSGSWVEKRLGEVGDTYSGLTNKNKEHFNQGNDYYIPFMNIMNNTIVDISNLDKVIIFPNESQNKVQKGDILFTTSSETPHEVGMCSVYLDNKEVYLNSFCFGFRLKTSNVNSLFLTYLLRYRRDIFYKIAQGATRYNLSKKHFNKIKIHIPPTLAEQEKIAEFLSSVDKKIELEEEKLNKLKEYKKGLLQKMFV